jgi:O-antigen/teichoic acid export membrane protein
MFWRGVLAYLPVNIIQAVIGFGTIVVFTRLLSPEDYGAYVLAYSVSVLAALFTLTWMEAAMARFYAAEPAESRPALFATLYRSFGVTALLAPIPFGLAWVLLPFSHALKLAIGVALLATLARSLLRLVQERRRAAGEMRGFAVIDTVQAVAGFVLGILFALLGAGASSPFIGVGLSSVICLAWALGPELSVARRGRFDRLRFKGYVAYGFPLALSLILSVTLASTDRFVLAAVTGEAAVGAYHAGYSLSSRTLDVIFLWLAMAGSPATVAALERSGEAALRDTARQQASLMILLTVPAAVGVALVADPLAQLMVGRELVGAVAVVTPWIAVGALFSGLTTHYLNTAFTLSRKPMRQMAAVIIPAVANLVLCLVLIPRYGLQGAAWATAISYTLGAATSYVLMRGCIRLPVPWGVIAKTLVACLLMGAALRQLPAMAAPALELALKATVGAGVYGIAILAMDAGGLRTQILRRLQGRALGPAA